MDANNSTIKLLQSRIDELKEKLAKRESDGTDVRDLKILLQINEQLLKSVQ